MGSGWAWASAGVHDLAGTWTAMLAHMLCRVNGSATPPAMPLHGCGPCGCGCAHPAPWPGLQAPQSWAQSGRPALGGPTRPALRGRRGGDMREVVGAAAAARTRAVETATHQHGFAGCPGNMRRLCGRHASRPRTQAPLIACTADGQQRAPANLMRGEAQSASSIGCGSTFSPLLSTIVSLARPAGGGGPGASAGIWAAGMQAEGTPCSTLRQERRMLQSARALAPLLAPPSSKHGQLP